MKVLPTLNSSLSANSGGQTHSTSHEVGKDLVGAGGAAGLVFAEVGDLQGRATLLGGSKGAVERGLRIGDSPPLLAGGDSGAGGVELLAGASAQQSAGSGGERHGDAIDHGVGSVDRNCVASSGGRVRRGREWMKSEVEVGARAFASDRNHGACHWLQRVPGLDFMMTASRFYTFAYEFAYL